MGSSLGSFLTGILSGAGGLTQGMQAADEQALKQRQLDMTKQQLDATQRHQKTMEDQAYLDLPPELAKTWGLSTPRIRKELAPLYSTAYDKAEARRIDAQKNAQLDAGLAALERVEKPGTPPSSAFEGQNETPVSPVVTTDPQMAMLRQLLPAIGHEKAGPVVLELVKERATGKKGKVTSHLAQDGTYNIATDEAGNIINVAPTGLKKPEGKQVFGRQDIENQLNLEEKLATLDPRSPEYAETYKLWQRQSSYNDSARMFPLAPGAEQRGVGTGLRPQPAPPGVAPAPPAAGATVPPQARVSRPAMPSDAAVEDYARIDAAASQLEGVLNALRRPGGLGEVAGGVGKNPMGAARRFTETYLGFGMSEDQRKTLANLETQLQYVKQQLIGATRTRPELADIAAAIPDAKGFLSGDSAEQLVPKIEAMLQLLRADRSSREAAGGGVGKAVPPRPGAAAPQAPASSGGWGQMKVR